MLGVFPTIAPFMSLAHDAGMKDPRFAPHLEPMKSLVHSRHPNGLKFWEEEHPTWMTSPDMVRGITQVLVSSGLIPLNTMHISRHDANGQMTEEQYDTVVKNINPFIHVIPQELREEFTKLSIQALRPASLRIKQRDGSYKYSSCPEIVFHGTKW